MDTPPTRAHMVFVLVLWRCQDIPTHAALQGRHHGVHVLRTTQVSGGAEELVDAHATELAREATLVVVLSVFHNQWLVDRISTASAAVTHTL